MALAVVVGCTMEIR